MTALKLLSDSVAFPALTGAGSASGDLFLVYDLDAAAYKSMTRAELMAALAPDLWPAVSGETGIVSYAWPPGDVRRYGVSPDAAVVSGITVTAGSPTVSAAAGTFTAAMVGKYFLCRGSVSAGTFSALITARASDGSSLTLASNATADWTGKAIVGTNWEAQHAARMTAVYANATLPGVRVLWPRGLYATGLNFSNTSSGTKMHFEEGAVLISIAHLITSDASIMSNVDITGVLTTCDRFGTINLQDSFVERVVVKDGQADYGLSPPRGVHIYSGTARLEIRDMVIEGCSPSNGDAALALDDNGLESIKLGRVRIKDSDVNGAILSGSNHTIGELIVEGFGGGAYLNTANPAQAAQLCGAHLGRCPGLRLGTLRLDQRANATLSCTTVNASATVSAASGVLAAVKVGQVVNGTNIAAHSLASTGTTSGSANITGSGFTANLAVGQPVSGTGIPNGTFVKSITSNTAAVLSEKATATGSITMTAQCVVTGIRSDGSFTISNPATGAGTQTLTFARPNALYPLRVLETEATGGSGGMASIDLLIARNVARRGLSIGDRSYPVVTTFRTALAAREIFVEPRASTALDSGWQLLHLEPTTDGAGTALVGRPTVRFANTYGNDALYLGASVAVDIGAVDTTFATVGAGGACGRGVQGAANVSGRIGGIDCSEPGSSAGGVPVDFSAGALKLDVGPIKLAAPSLVSIDAVKLDGCTDCSFGPIHTTNFRGWGVHLNNTVRTLVKLGSLAETSVGGSGLRVKDCTDVRIEQNGTITGWAKGTTGSGTNTRVTLVDVRATGNTTNSDLPATGITTVGSCLNATA